MVTLAHIFERLIEVVVVVGATFLVMLVAVVLAVIAIGRQIVPRPDFPGADAAEGDG